MSRFDAMLERRGVAIDASHACLRDLYVRYLSGDSVTGEQVDALLNQCTGGEFCEQCSVIFCAFGEPLHFHHDGCPCCALEEPEPSRDEYRARMQKYHGVQP